MEPRVLNKLYILPLIMGVWIFLGMITCYIISVLEGHVSVYVPFISEAGGKLPESGIFGIFLAFTAYIGFAVMTIRYLIVSELNGGNIRKIDFLNKASVFVGYLSLCGMVIVGCYPMYGVFIAHMVGASFLFFGGIIYAFLQVILTYWMCPTHNGVRICRIRLAIMAVSILCLLITIVMVPIGHRIWNGTMPKANKVPSDKGFAELLVCTLCEWIMAISFIFFFFTFANEFKKTVIHISLIPLVRHFDEEVSC